MNQAQIYGLIGIPEIHWKVTREKLPPTSHSMIVGKYIDNLPSMIEQGQGLYLHGDYGMGKSGLAALILKYAIVHRVLGYWVRAKNIPEYVISHARTEENVEVYTKCLETPLLVIDEFQVRDEVRFTETIVEDIIRMRLDDRRSTIVTSNVTPGSLSTLYPALLSVLKEGVLPVKVAGFNFRTPLKGILADELR
jgi:DNA replication protein DnaC